MLSPDTVLQSRYRIVDQLGKGGMGTVYEAIDERFDNQVAIKETHFSEDALRKQFEREARLLNRLRHPALTRVIDHFAEGDGQFLVMDYIAGDDLSELMQRRTRPFPVTEVMNWADQLLDALDYLHHQEPPIVHRDIKPQNLKVTRSGQIILLDFGLAKGFAGQLSRVTTSGSIFGYTPNYAPLEQIQGTGTDARSDLYSLGATLYHLLTNVTPPDVLTRLTATTDGEPDPLRRADEVNQLIPAELSNILAKAMAIGRNQRPATAAAMRKMLNQAAPNWEPPEQTQPDVLPATLIDPGETEPAKDPPLPATVASPTTADASHPPETPKPPAPDVIPTIRVPAPPPVAAAQPGPTSPKSNSRLWIIAAGLIGLTLLGGLIGLLLMKGVREGSIIVSTDEPFRVGVFTDLSGQTSSFGQSTVNGIKLAADEINKSGGIDGRQIVIITEDDQGLQDKAAEVATKLITQDKVHALLGDVASMLTLAAAPSAQNANVPLISPASTNPKVTTVGDYIFRACFVDPFQGAAMAKFAQNSLGARTAAILIDTNSDYSHNLAQTFETNFTQLGGQIVSRQYYQQRDKDFMAQLKSIQASHPDVIFLPGFYEQAAAIGRQAKQIGLTQPLLGGDGWDSPQLFDLSGDALNGSFITNHFSVDNPDPAVQKFLVAYRARYNINPDAIAALAYDAVYLLAESLKRAGSSEGQKLRDAIARTKNFQGVTGAITIDSDRNAVKPVVILQVQSGKFIYKESIQPN